jgi:hypothetical protein
MGNTIRLDTTAYRANRYQRSIVRQEYRRTRKWCDASEAHHHVVRLAIAFGTVVPA